MSNEGATAGSARTEPYPSAERGINSGITEAGTTAESAEGVALDTTGTGDALVEEAITVTVVAGADTGEVAEEVEFVTTDAVVDRVGGEITAVAAARLEAW